MDGVEGLVMVVRMMQVQVSVQVLVDTVVIFNTLFLLLSNERQERRMRPPTLSVSNICVSILNIAYRKKVILFAAKFLALLTWRILTFCKEYCLR